MISVAGESGISDGSIGEMGPTLSESGGSEQLARAAAIAQGLVDEMHETLDRCDEALYETTFPRRRRALLGKLSRRASASVITP